MVKTTKRQKTQRRVDERAASEDVERRRALKREIALQRQITKLSILLEQRVTKADRALLYLAGSLAARRGFELVKVEKQRAVNE